MEIKICNGVMLGRTHHGKIKLFSECGEKGTKIKIMRQRIDIGARENRPAKITVVLEGESTLHIGERW